VLNNNSRRREVLQLMIKRKDPKGFTMMKHALHYQSCRHKVVSLLLCCRYLSSNSYPPPPAEALNLVVITGTTRTEGPPKPVLGPRVAKFICQAAERRGNNVAAVLDPLDLDLPLLRKPHFAYAKSRIPQNLQELADVLRAADGYVTITPEYNHAPSPALLNILNHFGFSLFSFKPSAIISYSAGQWGGTRAAHALRPILSELGCLPVSAMIHMPYAQKVLDENGGIVEQEERDQWVSYTDRCLAQLEWWGEAAKTHRNTVDPMASSPAFVRSPSQRDAP
jgi:chromate reductase